MVEKTGHKVVMRNERLKWIDEGRPKSSTVDDEEYNEQQLSGPRETNRIAPIFEKAAGGRATTPAGGDNLFGDDDLYNATPRAKTGSGPCRPANGDLPDEDDLDALMAEAEASTAAGPAVPSFGSIFGGGMPKRPVQPPGEPDDDDLDALMAEAELHDAPSKPSLPPAGSIFGNGKQSSNKTNGDNEDDLDALMAEAEAQAAPGSKEAGILGRDQQSNRDAKVDEPKRTPGQGDDDDLDALMAEAEASAAAPKAASAEQPTNKAPAGNFEDEEEAMAEMDGLW